MAKRIYWESIKKWAKEAGIPAGLAGFTILFMYLSFLGVIEITGHSGDMVCAGTIDDPCIALINFSVKEDVFIYPIDYDPYGRNTPFETDKVLKSWKMYRSWGKGWREIKLNETCRGTWCGGKYGLKNNKYSFAFRKDKNYSIKIIAYKEDPYENIKWGFGPLDPVWKGIGFKEYGPGFDRICSNGICTLTLYSGIRNVYEDKTWKRVEHAKSLKNSGIELVFKERDSKWPLEIIDYNLTHAVVNLKGKNTVIEFDVDKIFKYGPNSTTIVLQENDTENLEDTYFYGQTPDANKGDEGAMYLANEAGWEGEALIKFDLTSVPVSSQIENSDLFIFIYSNAYDTAELVNVSVKELDNQTWVEGTGASDGSELCWNNQIGGIIGDVIYSNDSFDGDYDDFWMSFNVTSWVSSEYGDSKSNVSFYMIDEETGVSDYLFFYSGEYTTNLSRRPYLSITYSEVIPEDTCTCAGAGNDWEVDMEDNCNLTEACTLTTGNLSWVGSSGYFNCSANLNLTNRDAPPSNTIFYFSDGCKIIHLIILIFISTTIFKKKRSLIKP